MFKRKLKSDASGRVRERSRINVENGKKSYQRNRIKNNWKRKNTGFNGICEKP